MTEWSEMGVTWTPARVAFNSRGTGILPVGRVGFQPAEVKRSGGTPDRPTDWKSVPLRNGKRAEISKPESTGIASA